MNNRGPLGPLLAVVLLAIGFAGCASDTAPSPTAPASIDPALRVTIDSTDSSAAVMAQSEVRFEAVVGNASVRDVRIDFGDGESAMQSSARHVYNTAGTYTAKATFTTLSGQQVAASRPVVVKAVDGLWYHAAFNASSRRFEIRRLTLTQEGNELRGVLSANGASDRPVTGTLSGERRAQFSADGQTFEGMIPSSVNGADALWPLSVQGGTASGQTLPFNPAVGEPSSPPAANLVLRRPEGFIVEGLEIGYDASGSSGDGLIYFVEFGDGEHTTAAVSDHAPGTDGNLGARLTVVDRFGRFDVTTERYLAQTLWMAFNYGNYHYWISAFTNPANGRYENRQLIFERHEGRLVTGTYRHPERTYSHFTGTLSGSRDIYLVLDGGGIEFTGTLGTGIELTLRGGSANGQRLLFQVTGY